MTNVDAATVVPETEPGGRIFQTCAAVLRSIEAIYKKAGVELPESRFVSDGSVAYTTPLLAVEVVALRPGRPGGAPTTIKVAAGTVYSLEVSVHLVRPAVTLNDVGEGPTAEELTAAAQGYLADWWTLLQGILLGRANGAYGDPGDLQAAPYREIMIQEITAYGPNTVGGLVATLVCEML